jgi:hypothetical protein
MKYLVFIFYYIYAIVVVGIFSYVIFVLNKSAWWFVLAVLLLNNSPIIKKDKDV